MSVKHRATRATGPRSNSSWTSPPQVRIFTSALNASQVFTASVGTSEIPIWVAPSVATRIYSGGYQDALEGDGFIGHLNAVTICPGGAGFSASNANLTLGLVLKRAGATVGGGNFAGWATGANPAMTAFTPLSVPFLVANTALVPAGETPALTAANALLPLKPNDVICLSLVVATADVTTMPFLDVVLDWS